MDLLPGFEAGAFVNVIDGELVVKHANLEVVNEGCYGNYQLTGIDPSGETPTSSSKQEKTTYKPENK